MVADNLFSNLDRQFMSMAMDEAALALAAGDFPVGAVLTINGEYIDRARNTIYTDENTTSHAEMNLLRRNSPVIRGFLHENRKPDFCLYTTLEPCMMCMGAAVQHRVSRIVIATPDPHGGAVTSSPEQIGLYYAYNWPQVDTGLFREDAADLIIRFLETGKALGADRTLQEFLDMKAGWLQET